MTLWKGLTVKGRLKIEGSWRWVTALRGGFFRIGKICKYLGVRRREKAGMRKRMNISKERRKLMEEGPQ